MTLNIPAYHKIRRGAALLHQGLPAKYNSKQCLRHRIAKRNQAMMDRQKKGSSEKRDEFRTIMSQSQEAVNKISLFQRRKKMTNFDKDFERK